MLASVTHSSTSLLYDICTTFCGTLFILMFFGVRWLPRSIQVGQRQGYAKSKCGKFYVFWHWFVVFPFWHLVYFFCALTQCVLFWFLMPLYCVLLCVCAVNPISQDSNVAVTHCATQRKDKIHTEKAPTTSQ